LIPWYVRAWAWLKKNWKAVLLGVSTLGVGLLVGRVLKKPQVVVNPELVEAEEVRRQADEELEKKTRDAALERDRQFAEVIKEHEDTVAQLTDQQKAAVQDLEDDPQALNDYLLEVGRGVRQR
jgi:hypothetical protein